MMRKLALCCLGIVFDVQAASLGVVGEVFVVEEDNLITFLEEKMNTLQRTGELEVLQEGWVRKVSYHINHPKALELKRANQTTHHHYSPSIVLQQDVRDEKGHVLWPKGLRFNAFDNMQSYHPVWLFFNAEDNAQIDWATQQLTHTPKAKVILTGGEIAKTESLLNTPIYFDQGGRITRQLGITSVPASVSRDKNRLLIEEVAIGENGHAR